MVDSNQPPREAPDVLAFFGFGGGPGSSAAPAPAAEVTPEASIDPRIRAQRATRAETVAPEPIDEERQTAPDGIAELLPPAADNKPVRKNRRKESVSKLVKESEAKVREAKVDGSQLDKRLKALNETAAPEADASSARGAAARWPVIDHESPRYVAWSALMTVLAFYSNFVNSYQLAFYRSSRGFDATLVLEYLIDVAFLLNLALGFAVTHFAGEEKVAEPARIARHYVRSPRFWADALACLPLDVVQLAVGWNPLCRANKLCRLYSLAHHAALLQRATPTPALRNALRVGQLVIIWLQTPHLLACVRLLLLHAAPQPHETGEWRPPDDVAAADPFRQYLHALYWCMGLMTGFGDGDTPESGAQYAFTLFVINLGLFTFAYTVGVLGALGAQRIQRANDFQVPTHAMQALTTPCPHAHVHVHVHVPSP